MLMCYPKEFDVIHYKLNHHMGMVKTVDKSEALKQWGRLKDIFVNNGIEVNLIEPAPGLVDMVFTANGAILHKNLAIISNFKATPRADEADHYEKWFKDHGYETYRMDNYFEGAGDGLFSHDKKHLWLGYGFRSVSHAQDEIIDVLSHDKSLETHTLRLLRPAYYHLDTCFCPLNKNQLLIYEKAFDAESLKKIYSVYDEKNVIRLSDEDAANFAGNTVCFGTGDKYMVVGHKYTDALKKEFKDRGFEYFENNMSEFLLSGGSTKCSVLDVQVYE